MLFFVEEFSFYNNCRCIDIVLACDKYFLFIFIIISCYNYIVVLSEKNSNATFIA